MEEKRKKPLLISERGADKIERVSGGENYQWNGGKRGHT